MLFQAVKQRCRDMKLKCVNFYCFSWLIKDPSITCTAACTNHKVHHPRKSSTAKRKQKICRNSSVENRLQIKRTWQQRITTPYCFMQLRKRLESVWKNNNTTANYACGITFLFVIHLPGGFCWS